MIATRGVDAGAVVTRISFDTDSSVPKLLFKAVRFITEEEAAAVAELVQSSEVITLKTVTMGTLDTSTEEPTGGDRQEAAPAVQAAPQRPAKPAPVQQAAPQPQRPQQAAKPAPVQQVQRPQAAVKVENSKPVPTAQRPAPQRPQAAATSQPPVQEVGSDDELADILAGLE